MECSGKFLQDISTGNRTIFPSGSFGRTNIYNQAAVKGWVEGQPDGSFAPDRSITRAEAMTTINRVLGRLPETADDLLDDMIAWPDNPPDAWYYLAVQEATNSHDYERKADTVHETWTGLQPAGNWAQYQ